MHRNFLGANDLKILILTRQERSRPFDTLFSGIEKHFPGTELVKLTKAEIDDFSTYLGNRDFSGYDRVLFDVPLRRVGKAYKKIARIRGAIFYEEDACQEFVESSKYKNRFGSIFLEMKGVKIVVTGFHIAEYLRSLGVDATCIPKAYDDACLKDIGLERSIDLAFVGRTNNRVYDARRKLLGDVAQVYPLQLLRTETPEEYLELLNKIRIFLSADIGYNEYMAKNFEAMACGCLVVAKKQPSEDELLGFVDMENIVHYDSVDEAIEKLQFLLSHPAEVQKIALAGCELAQARHSLSQRVPEFVAVLAAQPAIPEGISERGLWQRLGRFFGR